MTSSSKPTILWVHGAWHPPSFYRNQLQLLETHGFPTSCPQLPTVGNGPPTSLEDDAAVIRTELTRLVEHESTNVIVIAHSYGGIVASQAVDAICGKAYRTAEGKPGGVVRLLFVAAFVVPRGQSLSSAFGFVDELPPFIAHDKKTGLCMMREPERRFYSDLPGPEQKQYAAQLVESSGVAQMMPISQAAYLLHPLTYLFCDGDQALPIAIQEKMVSDAEGSMGGGNSIAREHCGAGHSPFLSQPEAVLRVIEKIAAAVV